MEGPFISFLRQSLGLCIARMALAVKDPIQKAIAFLEHCRGFTLRSLVAEQAIKILMDAVYMLAEGGTANIHTFNLAPNWLDWNPEDNSAV
jgi:hypothetical protein